MATPNANLLDEITDEKPVMECRMALLFEPEDFKTAELCLEAVKQWGWALKHPVSFVVSSSFASKDSRRSLLLKLSALMSRRSAKDFCNISWGSRLPVFGILPHIS